MIVNKIAKKMLFSPQIRYLFGGGGHHKVYDWRDDHLANPDYGMTVGQIGVKRWDQYTMPYSSDETVTFEYTHPPEYNPKDLTMNMTGTTNFGHIRNRKQPMRTEYLADIAHEYDYESEDLDFQPESFETQHFRKKGPFWLWVVAGTVPLWFVCSELFLQYWPQDDNWRYQRPPPLNYPDDTETPDTEYFEMFQSQPYKDFYDAGIVVGPFFDIIDGKKVYTKTCGVNQPRDAL